MDTKKRKALFLDLDGTLLTDDKMIPQGNRDAIDEMLRQGHSVIIATGRPLSSAVLQAERLGLTSRGCYIIAFNGGVLYDTFERRVIYRSTIPLDFVRKAFAEANRRGIHIQTYRDDRVIVEPAGDDGIVRQYCSRMLVEEEVIPDIALLDEEPVKMLIIDPDDTGPLHSFREWIGTWADGVLDTFFSSSEYVEIVSKGLNKGNALLQMADILGIDRSDTVAAGDAANDISMIEAAGLGCVMCNGTDDVKSVADYVTERDNNNCGVAEIIGKFILERQFAGDQD
ncbi:MAG: HAD family phosphatase [Oscillospiraceae bacterium]|nr:HAD family phosphatase [Oscillospiraceae bacterium]